MPYKNFDEVASLDSTAQRQLLREGEPAERVWAAWALGLQFGSSINADLIASVRESPHPGTRRQLVVVLAGHGEHSILQVLAQHDSDEYVRATACQYLIQTAQPNDTQRAAMLIERLTSDDALIVRQAILAGARTGYPQLSPQILSPFLWHDDMEIRQAALATVLSLSEYSPIVDELLERVLIEPERDLRIQLEEILITSGNSHRLLQAAHHTSVLMQLEILDMLIEAKKLFDWSDIASLSAVDNSSVNSRLVRLIDPDKVSGALPWLIHCIVREFSQSAEWPSAYNSESRDCAYTAVTLLLGSSSHKQPIQLTTEDRSELRTLIASLEDDRNAFKHDEEYFYAYLALEDALEILTELKVLL